MSLRSEFQPGEFCWVDLMAHDMESAAKFYESLLGWTTELQDTQGGPPYAIFQLDGKRTAGMGQLQPEMQQQGVPPIWNSYISVVDLQATVDKAVDLGASVMMPPMDVMQAGRMAIIKDPTGAAVSLWQPNQHIGAEKVNEVGCYCWNELATRDLKGAQKFFAGLFGWTFEKNEHSPTEYYIIKHGDRMAGGMLQMGSEFAETPPCWMVYFTIADMDAACTQVHALGGKIMVEPFDAPQVGKIAVAADPQGGAFSLIEMSVEPD